MKCLILIISVAVMAGCAAKNYPADSGNEVNNHNTEKTPRAEDVFKQDSTFYDPNPTMERSK